MSGMRYSMHWFSVDIEQSLGFSIGGSTLGAGHAASFGPISPTHAPVIPAPPKPNTSATSIIEWRLCIGRIDYLQSNHLADPAEKTILKKTLGHGQADRPLSSDGELASGSCLGRHGRVLLLQT